MVTLCSGSLIIDDELASTLGLVANEQCTDLLASECELDPVLVPAAVLVLRR